MMSSKVRVLALDPGESTGWASIGVDGLKAGTLPRNHAIVADFIKKWDPQIIVLERFNLYPGKAQALSWNSFYPVEVIGVVKYLCAIHGYKLVEQAPSIKKYAGGFGEDWERLKGDIRVTEHAKDAYLHLKYYLRMEQAKKEE